MTTGTRNESRITTEICAYCHALLGESDPSRCGRRRSQTGRKLEHRFDEIEMDARLVEIASIAGLERIRPNFWWGFDLPAEGVRFSTEYASGDENIDLIVFDGDPERGAYRYKVSFQAETPLSVIFAAAAEAMGTR